jgi:hypothetical protein
LTKTKDGSSFRNQVLRDFGYLISEYGFELMKVHENEREAGATIVSSTSEVFVLDTHLCALTVLVRRLRRPNGSSWPHGLLFLVRDSCPEEEAILLAADALIAAHRPFRDWGYKSYEVHAKLLRRAGADMLAGDFSRERRLKRLAAEEQRRRNKATFGTSTGETPRFAETPTLEALFADAANDPPSEARVYQAVWDYNYTLPQISAFLGVDEATVQRMLDVWDHL